MLKENIASLRKNYEKWWNCIWSVYRYFSKNFQLYKSIKPLEWFSIKNYCIKRIKIKISYNKKYQLYKRKFPSVGKANVTKTNRNKKNKDNMFWEFYSVVKIPKTIRLKLWLSFMRGRMEFYCDITGCGPWGRCGFADPSIPFSDEILKKKNGQKK